MQILSRSIACFVIFAGVILLTLSGASSQEREIVYRCPPQTLIKFEFSPKGDVVAVRTGLTELSFLATTTWQVKKCRIPTRAFTYIDSESVAVVGENDRLYIVDPRTGRSVSSHPLPGQAIGQPTTCGGNLCVPTGSLGEYSKPSTVNVMNVKGRVIRKITTIPMAALYASSNGRWLAVLGWDRAIVYEVRTWKKVADIKWHVDGFLTLCAFSSNGKLIFLGDVSHQMIVETDTWKRKEVPPHPGHHLVAAIPEPAGLGFLVSLTDGSLRTSSDTLVRVVPGPGNRQSGDCVAAALGPRGLLLTGWENGDIRKKVVTLR